MASIWAASELESFEDDVPQTEISEKDALLFVIDCFPKMFQANEHGETPFRCAIKCALTTLQNKIVSSENDLFGVVLYSTDKKKNPAKFEHIYVLQDLAIPDVERILELDSLLSEESEFDSEIGSTDSEFPLGNVFWVCSSLFSATGLKKGFKRIFLITNEDNPHKSNPTLQHGAKTRARDLFDLGIGIELFNLSYGDHDFDPTFFYEEVLGYEIETDSSLKFEELLTRVRRREAKKRSLMRIPFWLGEQTNVSLKVYSMYQEAKKGAFVYLDSRTNSEVKAVSEWVCHDTTATLTPNDFKYYFNFGGCKAMFEKEEILQIKQMGPPGLALLGFKPLSNLKLYHNIRHSYFAYPDDEIIKGSTLFLKTMILKLNEMRKFALCRMIARQNSPPRLVALVPQEEELDEYGTQIKPPGFHIVFLPFADDIRTPPIPEIHHKAAPNQIDKAKEIVSKLMISKFSLDDFENPLLQSHYANLQAIALDQDVPDEIVDFIDHERIERRTNLLCQEFTALFAEEENLNESKKQKIDFEFICNDESKMKKFKVAELKEFLDSLGIPPKKKKAELIQQIQDHFAI